MAKFSKGGDVKAGNGGMFLTPDKDKGTIVYLLTDKDGIRWTANQVSCFVSNGKPCNASWISVGKDDPGIAELGLKGDGYAAWIPVAIKENDEWVVKFWQTNKTNHSVVAGLEAEWPKVVGLRLKIAMVNKRWTVSALPPAAKGNPTDAELKELVSAIPDDDTFGEVLGPDNAQGVRELLMKRLNVPTWKQVLIAFGVKSSGDVDGDIEVEDV